MSDVPRPLLVTANQSLLDRLVQLGDLAGTELQVQREPWADADAWRTAPLVLLGSDAAGDPTRWGLPAGEGWLVDRIAHTLGALARGVGQHGLE